MKTWTPAEVRALRKGVAPRARKQRDWHGQILVTSGEAWIAECAGGCLVMYGGTGEGTTEPRAIGFLSLETVEQLVKRGEPVPLGPLPEGET